jgi:hypothetical protein
MFDPFVSVEEIKENIEFIENKHIVENTYIFNALNICKYNKKFWRNIKLSGLSKGKRMNSIYCHWDFEHDSVASIYSIVKKWERAREYYYQVLNTFSQSIDDGKNGQLRYLQMEYRQIQKCSRFFDLAFLKVILLCFKSFSNQSEFLISTLRKLEFEDKDIYELMNLSSDYRNSSNVLLKKDVLKQIILLFAERKLTYLQQPLKSKDPKKDDIIIPINNKLVEAIEKEANLIIADFS